MIDPTKPYPWLLPAGGALAIFLATFLAYLPAMQGDFIWDDDTYVTSQEDRLASLEGLGRLWRSYEKREYRHQYYPLTMTAFWAQYQLWGLKPFGFHVTNVLLHSLSGVLLWRVLRKLNVRVAWLAGAVFALHPVHVQSVAWITELKNALSGMFFLATLLAWLRFEQRWSTPDHHEPQAPRFPLWPYALTLLLMLCALLSKTASASAPVALALALWYRDGRVRARHWAALAPLAVMGLSLILWTVWLEKHHGGAHGSVFEQTWIERMLVAGRALWFYAGKLLWPVNQSFIYPRWHIDASAGWQYLFPLALVSVMITLWTLRSRIGRGPFAGALFFCLAVGPMAFFNVYMTRYSYVSDHWQYWASMGLIPVLVTTAAWAFRRYVPLSRPQAIAAATLLLAILGVRVWQQGHIYKDVETLWRDTLAKNPACALAHNNLGVLLRQRGDWLPALRHFESAIEAEPRFANAHANLGLTLTLLGEQAPARQAFEESIRLEPRSHVAQLNLGQLLLQQNLVSEALGHFQKAVELHPRSPRANFGLGLALERLGRHADALACFEIAAAADPDWQPPRDKLNQLRAATPPDHAAHDTEAPQP